MSMKVNDEVIYFAIGDKYTYILYSFFKRHALLNTYIYTNECSSEVDLLVRQTVWYLKNIDQKELTKLVM